MNRILPLLLLAGCVGGPSSPTFSVSVALDETVVTVPRVSWWTATPQRGWVEYGPDTTYGHVTPIQAEGTDQSVPLLGVPADTTWHYRVVLEGDGPGEDGTVTTGTLPDEIPAFEVEGVGASAPGYTAFSWWSVVTDESYVAVVDELGRVVWYWIPDDYAQSVRFAADGTGLLALHTTIGADPGASIVRIPFDGEPTFVSAPNAHHDLVERPDGVVAWIAAEERTVDGRRVLGDRVVSLTPDGGSRVVWNAFEKLPLVENAGFELEPADWTHGNGLAWDDTQKAWTLSLYYDESILQIDDATGDTRWRLGGPGATVGFAEDAGFGPQHSPAWSDGELLVFDNAYDADTSRLVGYHVDVQNGVAVPQWTWEPAAPMPTRFMGSFVRLADGGVVSAWGENEALRWIDSDGQETLTLRTHAMGLFGKVDHTESLWPVDAELPEEESAAR